MQNSQEYTRKKAFYESIITLYGRNIVLEMLQDSKINIHKLHLSDSNKKDTKIQKMLSLASQRKIEVLHHSKSALSRISKNAKQDQGVAVDIFASTYMSTQKLQEKTQYRLIALDGIHNPQNLGMIIRSCAASKIDGIILPHKNSAKISPLVVKASSGTLFKLPIYHCNSLQEALSSLQEKATIVVLASDAIETLQEYKEPKNVVYVLGNESEGVSQEILNLSNKRVSIAMHRGVESLNVAVTASLIAFLKV